MALLNISWQQLTAKVRDEAYRVLQRGKEFLFLDPATDEEVGKLSAKVVRQAVEQGNIPLEVEDPLVGNVGKTAAGAAATLDPRVRRVQGIAKEIRTAQAELIKLSPSAANIPAQDLLNRAVQVVQRGSTTSVSELQRALGLKYNEASTLLDRLVSAKVVGSFVKGGQRRAVLITKKSVGAGMATSPIQSNQILKVQRRIAELSKSISSELGLPGNLDDKTAYTLGVEWAKKDPAGVKAEAEQLLNLGGSGKAGYTKFQQYGGKASDLPRGSTVGKSAERLATENTVRTAASGKAINASVAELDKAVGRHAAALKAGRDVVGSRKSFGAAIEKFLGGSFAEGAPVPDLKTMVRGNIKQWESQLVGTFNALGTVKGADIGYRQKLVGSLALGVVRESAYGADANLFKSDLSKPARRLLGVEASAYPAVKAGTGFAAKARRVMPKTAGGWASVAAVGLPLIMGEIEDWMNTGQAVDEAKIDLEQQGQQAASMYEQIKAQEILAMRAARLSQAAPGMLDQLNAANAQAPGPQFQTRMTSGIEPPQQAGNAPLTPEVLAAIAGGEY